MSSTKRFQVVALQKSSVFSMFFLPKSWMASSLYRESIDVFFYPNLISRHKSRWAWMNIYIYIWFNKKKMSTIFDHLDLYLYTWNPLMTPVWLEVGPCFGGLIHHQNKGQTGSRYIYIYISSCDIQPSRWLIPKSWRPQKLRESPLIPETVKILRHLKKNGDLKERLTWICDE